MRRKPVEVAVTSEKHIAEINKRKKHADKRDQVFADFSQNSEQYARSLGMALPHTMLDVMHKAEGLILRLRETDNRPGQQKPMHMVKALRAKQAFQLAESIYKWLETYYPDELAEMEAEADGVNALNHEK